MGGRLDTPHFHEAQVLVVAAAGNSATDPCRTYYDPVTTPDKLLVGATTKEGALASFSNFGACVHVQVLLPSRPVAHSARNPAPLPPVHVHVFLPAAGRPPVRSLAPRLHPAPASSAPPAMPHRAPATCVPRPPADTSRRRGLAQATPSLDPSAAPAWRRRMSPASPPSCSGRTRPSRWRGSRRLFSPPRR
jgi:subtilisin family serine protease